MALTKYDVTLADGRVLTVTPNLVDKIAFEVHLRNNKHLGSISDNVMRMQAFWGWSAAVREHGLEISWDEFLEGGQCIDVRERQDDDDTTEAVDGLGEGIPAGQHTS